MALIFANSGELLALNQLLNDGDEENFLIKLYKNDYTPVATSTAGDFTEADFAGYENAFNTLMRGSWGSPTTVSGKASSTYNSDIFYSSMFSADPQTIYGYYVVGSSSSTLYFAERFSTPRTVNANDTLTVRPVLTLNSES